MKDQYCLRDRWIDEAAGASLLYDGPPNMDECFAMPS
jgi:hypothetical protein